jgi:guanylate kinase
MVMDAFPSQFDFSVSHTSREARPDEVDGVDYHFCSKEAMREGVAEGRFLEHAMVHGNMYATSEEAVTYVQKQDMVCVLDIDVQGVQQMKKRGDKVNPVYVAVLPPSLEEAELRLRERHTESEEEIGLRMSNAQNEIDYLTADGSVHHVVVNGDMDVAFTQLQSIILKLFPSLSA